MGLINSPRYILLSVCGPPCEEAPGRSGLRASARAQGIGLRRHFVMPGIRKSVRFRGYVRDERDFGVTESGTEPAEGEAGR